MNDSEARSVDPTTRSASIAGYATSFSRKGAYSFDETAIRDLWARAKDFAGKDTTIAVSLEGNHNVSVDDINAFFEDAFIRHNYMRSLAITGSDYTKKPSRRISIGLNTDGDPAVSVSIAGDRQQCSLARTEVENILQAKRIWYSPLILKSGALMSLILGMVLSFLVAPIGHIIRKYFGMDESIRSYFITMAPLLIVALWFVFPFLTRLFPPLVFEHGKSAQVGTRAGYWRNVVGVGMALAFLVAIASDLFWMLLKQ
jgi:hypothetical protein